MKIALTSVRVLLGLVFTVFGLNGFLHFIPQPGPVPVLAGQFMGALIQSHYMAAVFALQLVCGVLLLANRYIPLSLALLAPVIVNILLFHILMMPAGLPLPAVVACLWLVLASRFRSAFSGLWEQRADSNGFERDARTKTAASHA